MSLSRSLQYLFLAIIVTTVGFSLYQWNASRASTQKTAPNNGLVGYWSFDDASGTTATDSSVNANNGTLTNGPTWGTGKVKGDVVFDGVDDYITTGNYYNVVKGTVSMWVNPTATLSSAAYYHAVNSNLNGSCDYVDLQFDGFANKWTFIVKGGCAGPSSAIASPVIPSNGVLQQWHHLVGTWDGSKGIEQLYVDGVLSAEVTAATFTVGNVSYTIGGNAWKDWAGSIDEVRIYNRALSADEVSQLYRLTAPTGVDTSLKGYWSFNGSTISGTTAYDNSGNGNNGTLTNGPTPTIGKLGQALSFNGSNNYVNIPHNSVLNFAYNQDFSVSLWAKIPATQNNTTTVGNIILQKWVNTGGYPYAIRIYNQTYGVSGDRGKIYALRYDGTNLPTVVSSIAVNDSVWHQINFIKNGSMLSLYVDGALSNTTTDTTTGTTTNSNPLYIGEEAGTSYPFTGSIDEVRVYSRALSSTEVSALYNAGR
jgi:hypothetical protein